MNWDKTVKWDARIRPSKGFARVDIKEIFRYRDLIILWVKRNFKLIYMQTILGPIWVILQPLLTTFVFTVVFGGIAKLPTGGMPPFLFYLAGNIAWQYFSSCLTTISDTFIKNRQIFGKIYFPRLCMPISTVITQLVSFFAQLVLFIVLVIIYANKPESGVNPNWNLLALSPLLLLEMAMLGLGFGIIVSALTTKYRDLALMVAFGAHLWMYATPVAYSSSLMFTNYPTVAKILVYNPMTPIIEAFRAGFLGTEMIDMKYLWISWGTTIAVLILGVMLFTRVERTFMDTV